MGWPCHNHPPPFLDPPNPMPLIFTSAFIEHLLYAMHCAGHWHTATCEADRAQLSWHLDSNRDDNTDQVFPAPLSSKEPSHRFLCSVFVDASWICISGPKLSPECQLHVFNGFPGIYICISNKYFKLNVSEMKCFHTFPLHKTCSCFSPSLPSYSGKNLEVRLQLSHRAYSQMHATQSIAKSSGSKCHPKKSRTGPLLTSDTAATLL